METGEEKKFFLTPKKLDEDAGPFYIRALNQDKPQPDMPLDMNALFRS